MIPKTYEEWKKCILIDCKINLTSEFVKERITTLENIDNQETKRFINLYGGNHYQNILSWFSNFLTIQGEITN